MLVSHRLRAVMADLGASFRNAFAAVADAAAPSSPEDDEGDDGREEEAPPADYRAAFRALAAPRKSDGQGCWTGQRGSLGHMCFVRSKIKLKSSENQARSAVPLAKAWSDRQVRRGDTVDLAEVDNAAELHTHPNAYLPSSVLRMAYSSVGRSIDDTGIGDRKAGLTALEGVAGIISSAAARRFQADVSLMRRLGSPFVLARHYDWSPWNVAFGSLQAKVAPLARYYHHDGQK